MTIGDRIKAARKAKGWSQPVLAEKCGWGHNQGRISHYERDRRIPTPNDMIDLENTLGLHRGALVGADAPVQISALSDAIPSEISTEALESLTEPELLELVGEIASKLSSDGQARLFEIALPYLAVYLSRRDK